MEYERVVHLDLKVGGRDAFQTGPTVSSTARTAHAPLGHSLRQLPIQKQARHTRTNCGLIHVQCPDLRRTTADETPAAGA